MDESPLKQLSPQALRLLESAAVATVVTLDADGAPHVSAAWVGMEDGEVVIGTLDDQRKLRNLRGCQQRNDGRHEKRTPSRRTVHRACDLLSRGPV